MSTSKNYLESDISESKKSPPQRSVFKILGIFFCLIILTVSLAGTVSAESIEINVHESASGTNWLYDSSTHILRLNGGTWDNIIASYGDLIIELDGENKITGGLSSDIFSGIYMGHDSSPGNLMIQDKDGTRGSLIINVAEDSYDVYGICVQSGSVTIENADVEINVTTSATDKLISGIHTQGGDVTISDDSHLVINVASDSYSTHGIESYHYSRESNVIISNSDVYVNVNGNRRAYGIYSDDINIHDGEVLMSTCANNGTTIVLYAYDSVSISGGVVSTISKGMSTHGIRAYNDVTISGGEVSVDSDSGKYAYGIGAHNNLVISGGEVSMDVVGYNNTRALYGYKSLVISGGDVSINAKSDYYTYGIYAPEDLTISGGTVSTTAELHDSGKAYGIYVGYDTVISGGDTTSKGTTQAFWSKFGTVNLTDVVTQASKYIDGTELQTITATDILNSEYKYLEIKSPVKPTEPESPMPIIAVLAGLSAAVMIRRK